MIVFRYLIKEVLKAQFAVLAVLLTIFISQQFVRVLADASDGEFPAFLIITILGLNLPKLAVLVIPLSLFLGILLAHGRMYTEHEMVILHGVGISEWYVTRVTMLVAGFNMLLVGGLAIYISPWAEEKQNQVLEQAQSEAGLASIAQGRFQTSPNGRAVVFVEKMGKNNELESVFVAQLPDPDDATGTTNIVLAKSGLVVEAKSGSQQLKLTEGLRYQGNPEAIEYQQAEFAGYQMEIKEQEVDARRRKLSSLPIKELRELDNAPAIAEFHWRLAVPIASLLMTLIAVPLARVNVRQGKFAKMFPAILLYLGYFGLMITGRKALEDEVLPTYLGMWWIHLSALLIGILLLSKNRPLGAKFRGLFKRSKVAV